MTAPLSGATAGFAGSRERFETVLGWLGGEQAGTLEHSELEAHLQADARELFRQLYQDHLDLRAEREPRIAVVADAEGVAHGSAEPGHTRGLATVFGPVQVTRIAYRARGQANLHPADGVLNLPEDRHSHGLRRLAAIEASRGSFDGAVEAIERGTGQQVGKRQVEELAQRSAADFDAFYSGRQPPAGSTSDVLVLSCDGKGVVMRPDALRAATAAAAATTSPKLATRLSKGEKRNRKRMAEVGTVYDATPTPRTPADILPATEQERREAVAGPVPGAHQVQWTSGCCAWTCAARSSAVRCSPTTSACTRGATRYGHPAAAARIRARITATWSTSASLHGSTRVGGVQLQLGCRRPRYSSWPGTPSIRSSSPVCPLSGCAPDVGPSLMLLVTEESGWRRSLAVVHLGAGLDPGISNVMVRAVADRLGGRTRSRPLLVSPNGSGAGVLRLHPSRGDDPSQSSITRERSAR